MDKVNTQIQIRVSEYEKNRIKWLADKYSGGNMSLLIVYATLNMTRRKIKNVDLLKTSSRNKKGDN